VSDDLGNVSFTFLPSSLLSSEPTQKTVHLSNFNYEMILSTHNYLSSQSKLMVFFINISYWENYAQFGSLYTIDMQNSYQVQKIYDIQCVKSGQFLEFMKIAVDEVNNVFYVQAMDANMNGCILSYDLKTGAFINKIPFTLECDSLEYYNGYLYCVDIPLRNIMQITIQNGSYKTIVSEFCPGAAYFGDSVAFDFPNMVAYFVAECGEYPSLVIMDLKHQNWTSVTHQGLNLMSRIHVF